MAAALWALPLTAGAFGGHTEGGHVGGGHVEGGHVGGGHVGGGHVGGGHVGMGRGPGFGHGFRDSGRANGFAFRHHGSFRDHNFARDGRFFRNHHRFRSDFAFFGFGFPYPYYPYYSYYPYDDYQYDYSSDAYGYGPAEGAAYANDLSVAVQSELARLGYYRGPIDGELGPGSRQAIRAFQAAKGLPVTGRIDPKFLRALERS
jgi:hypothetical protein